MQINEFSLKCKKCGELSLELFDDRCVECRFVKDIKSTTGWTKTLKGDEKIVRCIHKQVNWKPYFKSTSAIDKHLAVGELNSAIQKGLIKRKPCEKCGTTERVHGHHEDYSKPLDVVWLCIKHHATRHRELDTVKTTEPVKVSILKPNIKLRISQ